MKTHVGINGEVKGNKDLIHKWIEMGFVSKQHWEGGEAEVPEKTTGYELNC